MPRSSAAGYFTFRNYGTPPGYDFWFIEDEINESSEGIQNPLRAFITATSGNPFSLIPPKGLGFCC
jgi:hypothetical protein